MYAKIFRQIFDSSVAEDFLVRVVFQDLIILADPTGVVDMTAGGISKLTGVPLEIVQRALVKLAEPDPESRNQDNEGRRIALLDHRSWGWRVLNFQEYHALKDESAKRYHHNQRQKRYRERQRDARVTPSDAGDASRDARVTPALCNVTQPPHVNENANENVNVNTNENNPSGGRGGAEPPASDEKGWDEKGWDGIASGSSGQESSILAETPVPAPKTSPAPTPPKGRAAAAPGYQPTYRPGLVPGSSPQMSHGEAQKPPAAPPASAASLRLAQSYLARLAAPKRHADAAQRIWPMTFDRLLQDRSEQDLASIIEWAWAESEFWFGKLDRNDRDPVEYLSEKIETIAEAWTKWKRGRDWYERQKETEAAPPEDEPLWMQQMRECSL